MKVKALVAVRSGSTRVENKNIRSFADSNLLIIKLKQLKRIKNIDSVVVNSNDEAMLEIAKSLDCEVVLRNDYYASNQVSMSEVYKNMAESIDCDIIVYANVTNPLLKDETIINAIETYKQQIDDFDSLNSAHLIKEFLFKDNLPINYDLRKQPRSQDLPDIAALNFAISIISKSKMIECRNVVGLEPRIYLVDEVEALDIDNQIDFDFAEFLYRRNML